MPVTPSDLARTLERRAAARIEADATRAEKCRRDLLSAWGPARVELGLGRAWLIGSLAWGGFGERSDVDVVVSGVSLDTQQALAERLGAALGCEVDVLDLESLPHPFRERVLREGLVVA